MIFALIIISLRMFDELYAYVNFIATWKVGIVPPASCLFL